MVKSRNCPVCGRFMKHPDLHMLFDSYHCDHCNVEQFGSSVLPRAAVNAAVGASAASLALTETRAPDALDCSKTNVLEMPAGEARFEFDEGWGNEGYTPFPSPIAVWEWIETENDWVWGGDEGQGGGTTDHENNREF